MPDAEFVIAARFDTSGMEAQIAEQQERLRTAYNRIPGRMDAPDFESARAQINSLSDIEMGKLRGQSPSFGRAVNAYNTFAMTGSSQEMINQQSRDAKKQDNQLMQQRIQLGRQSLLLANQEYVNRVKMLSTFGALLSGNPMAALSNWAMTSAISALAGPKPMSGSATQAVQSAAGGSTGPVSQLASSIGNTIRKALGGPAENTEAGTLQEKQEEEQKTATEEQPVKTLAGGVPNILKDAVQAIPLIGGNISDLLKAGGASALMVAAANQILTQAAQTEQQLTANVAGPSGTADSLRNRAFGAVKSFKGGINYQEIADTYARLGSLGVRRPEIGQGGLGNISLAFGKLSGLPQGQVDSLTAALNVQGKMSPATIGAFYDAIYRGADKMGVSLTQLTETMQSFEKETTNAGLSMAGAQSLISLQGYLGRGIDAGAVAGNFANATGADLFKLASFTGISVDKALSEQQNNPGLFFQQYTDKIAQETAGQKDVGQRVASAEAIDKALGGYFGSAVNPTQQAQFWTQRFGPNGLNYTQWTAKHPLGTGNAQDEIQTGEAAAGNTTDLQTIGLNLLQAMLAEKGTNLLDELENYKEHPEKMAQDLGAYLKSQPADFLKQLSSGWPISPSDIGNLKDAIVGGADSLKDDVGSAGKGFITDVGTASKNLLDGISSFFGVGGADAAGLTGPYAGDPTKNPYTGGPRGGGPGGKTGSATVKGMAVPQDVLSADEVAANGDPNWLRLLLAQQYIESGFNPNAVSSAGAQGIAQFMPSTAASLAAQKNSPLKGKAFDPTNVQESAIMERYLMQQLLQQFGGSLPLALAAYNAGPGNVGAGAGYAATVQQIEHTITIKNTAGSNIQTTVETSRKNLGSNPQRGRHPMPAPQTRIPTRHNTAF